MQLVITRHGVNRARREGEYDTPRDACTYHKVVMRCDMQHLRVDCQTKPAYPTMLHSLLN